MADLIAGVRIGFIRAVRHIILLQRLQIRFYVCPCHRQQGANIAFSNSWNPCQPSQTTAPNQTMQHRFQVIRGSVCSCNVICQNGRKCRIAASSGSSFNGNVVLFRISVYITPHHVQWNIPTGAESFAKSCIPFTFRSSQLVIDVHSGDGEVERLCQLQQTPQQTNTICTA